MDADLPMLVRRPEGGLWSWAPAGGPTVSALLGVADPDWALTRSDCLIVKYDGKVWVGRLPTPAGVVYVKRYARGVLRTGLEAAAVGSPAFRAARAAGALAARGIGVPRVAAAVEGRRLGLVVKSTLVTYEVRDAETLDVYWTRLATLPPASGRMARRALGRAVATLFARLHGAGIYHDDLKDVNVLAGGAPDAPALTLLDLEGVRIGAAPVAMRRRRNNLLQLDRTLGTRASWTSRLRVLRDYLGYDADRAERRRWVARLLAARRRKDAEKARPAPEPAAPAPVSCAIVCQDEEAKIAACLAGVRWCAEVVVVDGGSRDGTVAIARAAGARVVEHPWAGYRAQKQFAFDQTTMPWILSVDADERVVPELGQALRRVLPTLPDDVAGVALPRLVPYLGRWWFRGGWYPRPMPRLVRRDRASWGGVDPHDRLEVRGRVLAATVPLLHYTYRDVTEHVQSVGKLTATAVRQIPAARRAGAGRLIVEPAWRFLRAFVVRRAALEGTAGLIVASTDAFYAFLRWASVWARRRGGA